MTRRRVPLDLTRIRAIPIARRASKVLREHAGRPLPAGAPIAGFLDSLPDVLAARDLRALVAALRAARSDGRLILWMLGGHVVKCGLGPVIGDLMRRGFVNAIAMNGAAAIHDAELAVWGGTSEDVAEALPDGAFGMAEETALLLNEAAAAAAAAGRGLGETLAARVRERADQGARGSLLCTADELGLPVTVHVALGTDVVHQHPSADGAAIGASTYTDFRLLAGALGELHGGGAAINVGSAVVMPEIFLKALSVARNVEGPIESFVTANFDFIRHYRPAENVVRRPTRGSGRGFEFIGHHEIMIPLLAAALGES